MFLVGIAGGSGSGKTTFAKKVLECLNSLKWSAELSHSNDVNIAKADAIIMHQDSYYLPAPPQHLRIHGASNFDHPEAFDWILLKKHLEVLKDGGAVDSPVYDFSINRRAPETITIGPCHTLLMEGIYTLWNPEIRDLFDLKIFLHVDADIRFIRRLHRDVNERDRSIDSIIRQYYNTVRPMHREYLEPTKQFADIVVGEETDIAAEIVAARIREIIRQKNKVTV